MTVSGRARGGGTLLKPGPGGHHGLHAAEVSVHPRGQQDQLYVPPPGRHWAQVQVSGLSGVYDINENVVFSTVSLHGPLKHDSVRRL